jgi:hypothetical protein
MILGIDFAAIKAALVGVLVGAAVTGAFLSVAHRRKVRKAIHEDNLRRAWTGNEGVGDRPLCLYSAHDPLNAGITRVRRTKD